MDKKLLVVEDNGTNRLILQHKLTKMGFGVSCVENGMEAIKFLQQFNIDLILMDVSMPVMDGLEATKYIREIETDISRMPIIGLSAHNHAEIRQKCFSAGMDDFLCKPVEDQVMLAKINEALAQRK
ncbi:MAG: response regulator [Rhizobiaceae bacterium]